MVTLHPQLQSERAPQPAPPNTIPREGQEQDPHSCGSLHSYGDRCSDKGGV